MTPDLTTIAGQRAHYAEIHARLGRRPRMLPVPRSRVQRPWRAPIVVEIVEIEVVAPPIPSMPMLTHVEQTEAIARIIQAMRQCGRISVRQIVQLTAEQFGLHPQHIFNRGNQPRPTAARHIAMAIARHFLRGRPHGSMPRIARQFARKDHTTVLHAVRKYGALVERIASEMP